MEPIQSMIMDYEDASRYLCVANREVEDDDDGDEEFCDARAWETLSRSFKEVQSVLDHNYSLIQQVNHNHTSKIRRNLAENVNLIREINANISKVIGLYSNLSTDFAGVVHQRRAVADKAVKNAES